MEGFPKISIITPNFNGATYLEETILSVLDQNYPNLEYIIIDGGSTDGSIDIIKKYEKQLAWWVSEPDNGVYHALQKGFSKSTGEIMSWINSDDKYYRNVFFSVSEILSIEGVNWITGAGTCFDEKGRTISAGGNIKRASIDYWSGGIGVIQQESTFWKRNLWNKAGMYISTEYKLAGDFELWNRFFKYDKLFTPHCLIGGFRMRSSNQMSLTFTNEYHSEMNVILKSNIFDRKTSRAVKKCARIKYLIRVIRKLHLFFGSFLIFQLKCKIERQCEFPQEIVFNRYAQKFEIEN